MKFFISGLLLLNLNYCLCNLAKDIQDGAYELLKGAIEGATEVIGTPVELKEVLFFLHTKSDINSNHTIDPLNPREMVTTNGKIFFLIHGWTQSREKTPWFTPLTRIIFDRYPESHVVQVDWGKAAANNYPFAAFTTESVGEIVGDLINKLVKEYNVPLKNIVLIGHSLGGQVSGWTGKRFQTLTNTKLPRIIALDPAGPLFSLRPKEKRLNPNDADIVLVVHTDGGKLGYGDSCGTIDFFPNGGSNQPGCYQVDLAKVSTLADPIWCDHRRGYDLFVEAVRTPARFMAKKCRKYEDFKSNKCEKETVSLGDLETTKSGSFYLDTSDKSPFVKEEKFIKNDTRGNVHQEYNPSNSNGYVNQNTKSSFKEDTSKSYPFEESKTDENKPDSWSLDVNFSNIKQDKHSKNISKLRGQHGNFESNNEKLHDIRKQEDTSDFKDISSSNLSKEQDRINSEGQFENNNRNYKNYANKRFSNDKQSGSSYYIPTEKSPVFREEDITKDTEFRYKNSNRESHVGDSTHNSKQPTRPPFEENNGKVNQHYRNYDNEKYFNSHE